MVVVDTNVVVALLVQGPKMPWSRKLREQEPHWSVPELWRHEMLNVLATMERGKVFPRIALESIWKLAYGMLAPCERGLDYLAALEMAASLSISGYDAQFLTLARQMGTVLVTEDKALLRKAPHLTRPLSDFKPGSEP